MQRNIISFVVLALFLALAAGTSGNGESSSSGSDKYKQTWKKSYGETDCPDWDGRMTAHQRFVMVGDIIVRMRQTKSTDVSIPSDTYINSVIVQINAICSQSTMALQKPSSLMTLMFLAGDIQ